MADEPEQLGSRIKAIERRLFELEHEGNVLNSIWENITVPLLGMVGATPAHRPVLAAMVDQAEIDANLGLAEERLAQNERRFALLRWHLLACDEQPPSI